MSQWIFAFSIGAFVALISLQARADDGNGDATTHVAPPFEPATARFGARGQLALLGGTTIGISYQSYESNATYFHANVAPELDYFVVRNLAIGLAISAGYGDTRNFGADGSLVETKSSSFLIGPRVSYNVPLGRYVSFFPSASFVAGSAHSDESLVTGQTLSIAGSANGGASTSEADAQIKVDASLYFHPRTHVLMGIGPYFLHDFARIQGGPDVGAQATRIGWGVDIGGYWGGERDPLDDAGGGPHLRTKRKFGDAHEVLLTNELFTDGSWTTHSGTSSSSGYFEVLLAADYFVLPHFSVGAFVDTELTSTHGVDATTQAAVVTTGEDFGAGFRLGYQIGIVDTVSVYPRATLSVGEHDFDETSGSRENLGGQDFVSVGAYVPLEVEIAPHFIAGIGPSIARDIASTTTVNGYSNPSTTYGAAVELGVWL